MHRTLVKIACYIGYYWFARWLPASNVKLVGPAARWLRYVFCRPLFKYCERSVNIQQGARFGSGRLLEIGEKSGIGVNCLVGFDIRIGKNVMMGPDVVVLGENHKIDRTDIPMIEQGHADRQPVTIKDDVWIGARTIILPGVTVGTGVVIGAGAVVTKDVNDFDIVAGNPARVIRNRKDGVVKSS